MKTLKTYVAALVLLTAFGGAAVAQQKDHAVLKKGKEARMHKSARMNKKSKPGNTRMAVKGTGVPQKTTVKKGNTAPVSPNK